MISSICSKESRFIAHWKSIFCQDKAFEIEVHHQIDSISEEFWSLSATAALPNAQFLQKPYLKAMSAFCDTWVVLFYHHRKPIGMAVFYLSTFQSNELEHELSKCLGVRDWIARKWTTPKKEQHVLVCGNPMISGEHAFVFDDAVPHFHRANLLCDAMNEVVKKVKANGIALGICLMKDFFPAHQDLQKDLRKCGFSPMAGEPVMMLPLLPEWKSLDDYQDQLISKFRSKLLTAYDKSRSLTKEKLDLSAMLERQQEWYGLYEQVYEKAQYQWKRLTAQAIIDLKKSLGDDLVMQAYFHQDQMIGFSIAILGAEEMEAHLVGMDYAVNKSFQLYSRMLYDYIELGIEQRKSWICFGRTALEIKSSIGALALPAQALIRHSKPVTNVLVRWLISRFETEHESLRFVWKQETYQRLISKVAER